MFTTYITMTKGERTKKVERGRVKRFEEEGWTTITSATSSKPQPKANVKAKAKVVKPKPVVEETLTDEEHDFMQQNEGFINDTINDKETD